MRKLKEGYWPWLEGEDDAFEASTKFKVSVEFFLNAGSHEEATARIHELIREGILTLAVEDKETGYTYDITDTETAELDL